MSNIQKQHNISPAIAWLTIQKFIIFYCPLDGEHTKLRGFYFIHIIFAYKQTNVLTLLMCTHGWSHRVNGIKQGTKSSVSVWISVPCFVPYLHLRTIFICFFQTCHRSCQRCGITIIFHPALMLQ